MTDIAQRASYDERRGHLDSIAAALHERGFRAKLGHTRSGIPTVHVTNPDMPVLSEDIACAQERDGTIAVFWSFGKRIADANETRAIADDVARVLAS